MAKLYQIIKVGLKNGRVGGVEDIKCCYSRESYLQALDSLITLIWNNRDVNSFTTYQCSQTELAYIDVNYGTYKKRYIFNDVELGE